MIPAAIRREVLERDGYECVAPLIDPKAGKCHDLWGRGRDYIPINDLQLDHVRVEPMMGKTAPSTPEFLVTLCPGHHVGAGHKRGVIWATRNRVLLREYLANVARKAPTVYEVDPPSASEVPPEMEPSPVRKSGVTL